MHHVPSAPNHASSNGLAKRWVQKFKKMMKKCSEGMLTAKVARMLFSYWLTPHTTTGQSPAELLLRSKLQCTLDPIKPGAGKTEGQIRIITKKAKGCCFKTGGLTLTRNISLLGPKWTLGIMESATGPESYKVMLCDGRVVRRHGSDSRSAPETRQQHWDTRACLHSARWGRRRGWMLRRWCSVVTSCRNFRDWVKNWDKYKSSEVKKFCNVILFLWGFWKWLKGEEM